MNNTFLPTLENYAPIKKLITTQVSWQISARKTMMKKSQEKITKKTEKEKLKKLNNKIVFDSRMFWKTISLLFQINCFIKRLLDWRKITKRLALTTGTFINIFGFLENSDISDPMFSSIKDCDNSSTVVKIKMKVE